MIISDLNYLEVVAEQPSILGGRRKLVDVAVAKKVKAKPKVTVDIDPFTGKNNIAVVNQAGVVLAIAVSVGGKAVAGVDLK